MLTRFVWVFVTLVFCSSCVARSAETPPQAGEFFEKKIRPLFLEHCQQCHGGDKVKGGLRIGSLSLLLKGGDSGPAVKPGDPEASLLIRSVSHADENLKMPPKGKLSDAQIADLKRWVKNGAVWPEAGKTPSTPAGSGGPLFTKEQREFWAFQAPKDRPVPAVRNEEWPLSPIDRFLLRRLEQSNLAPAAPADRRTLIRRATIDLSGLPPTPDEVGQFLADTRPDAFARVIDRLLASPAYGERWGRHWLDVARYADSNGLDENTAFGNAWRYRDYVVRAFNQDKPYDHFLREQLAGDLIAPMATPGVDDDRLIATGFLVLGPKVLAEPDKGKMVMDIVDEQLDVTFRAFLGLTAGCARCHDHKFDPIPTRDYYSLAGIFKSTKTMATLNTVARANERSLATRQEEEKAAKHKAARDAIQEKINKINDRETNEIRQTYRKDLTRYLIAASDLNDGKKSAAGARVREGKLEDLAKTHQLVPEVIKAWNRFLTHPKRGPEDPIFGPFIALADLPAEGFAGNAEKLVRKIESDSKSGASKLLTPVRSMFEGPAPKSLAEAAGRYGRLFESIEKEAEKGGLTGDREKLRQFLNGGESPFNRVGVNQEQFPPRAREDIKKLRDEMGALPAAPPIPMALAVQDEGKIENVRVHIRGNHLTLGADTPRQFPQIIAGENQKPLENKQSGRLQLADWMTQKNHPLTARVMVNRIWQHHFGQGLVRSPDNFGKLGDRPSHPELLDWLAIRFVENGWSVKSMHRMIMLSRAYQMSGESNEKAALADPDNRLLWHMPRRRMEIEAIRDSMLAISGKLDRTIGGNLLSVGNFDYVTNDGSGNGANYNFPRRSIYLPVIRNAVFDVFQVFDFVEPSVLNGKRDSTTVAPQALFLMNGPFVLEQSKALAEKLLGLPGVDDAGRVRELYSLAYGRPPSDEEVSQALGYLKLYGDRLTTKIPEKNKRMIAVWQSLCQVLFASNEFVFIP